MKEIINPLTSHHLLQDIVEGIPIRIFWKNREGCYLGCNDLFAKDAGFSHADELIGKTDFDMGWKNHAEAYRSDDFAVMESGESKLGYEEPQTTPNGQTIWLRKSKVPLRNNQNQVVGILGIYEDITSFKQSEEILRVSEERLALAMDGVNDGLWDWNLETNEVYYSPRWFNMLGYDADVLPATLDTWAQLVHPDDKDWVLGRATDYLEGRVDSFDVEMRMSHKDGRVVHVLSRASKKLSNANGKPVRLVGTHVDISERKQAEQQMAEREQTYRGIFNSLSEAVYILDANGYFLDVNEGAVRMYGFSHSYFIGKNPGDLSAPNRNDLNRVVEQLGLALQGEQQSFEFWAIDSKGQEFPKEVHLYPGAYFGQPVVIAVATDITERKQAEKKLQLTQFALDYAPDAIFWMEPDGVFVYVNEAACEMLGYTKEELLMMGVKDVDPTLPDGIPVEMAQATRDLGPQRIETIHRTKDGRDIPVEVVVSCIVHLGRECHCAFVRDITERKAANRALQDSEIKYRSLFDDARDLIHITDAEGCITDVNQAELERLGYSRKEMIGRQVFDFVHPEDISKCQTCFLTVKEGCQKDRFETRFQTSQGESIFVEVAASPQMDAEGKVLAVRAIMHDVTERKHAEQELLNSESRYRELLKFMPEGVVLHQEGQVVFANPEALRLFGFAEDESVGKSIIERIHPDDRAMAMARVQSLLEHKRGTNPLIEERVVRRDGSVFVADTASAYVEYMGKPAVLAVVRDVSDRKAAEQDLKDSEQRFRMYIEQVGDALFVHNLQGQIIDVNEQACSVMGYSRDEMLRMSVMDLDVAFDFEAAQRLWKSLEPGTPATIYGEHRRKDGSIFPVEIRVGCFALSGGYQFLAIARDISERNAAEKALKDSEQRLQNIITASPVPMVITRVSDGSVLYANAELNEMFGYGNDLEILRVVTPDHYVRREDRAEMLSQLQSTGRFKGEIEYRRLNGDTFWALVSTRTMQFGDEPAIIGLLIDMTDQHRLEEQLRQSQKMEAVGTMAGGIAHDFNNMLAGMLGQLFLLKKEISDRPESVGRIAKVEQQGFRAASIIEQLLTFARRGQVSMHPLPLAALLKETLKLQRVIIPENILIESYVDDRGIIINGDAGMIQQIIMNLLSNARDAVVGVNNPVITIALDSVAPDDECYQRYAEFEGKNLACLSVRDNGIGIPESLHTDIFDPFFTTKEVGKGTGLGLAMTYGAMQTHDGAVELESELGFGAEFRLYFPRIDEGVCDMPVEYVEATPGDGVGVLLADDEEDLREVLQEALEGTGYRVFAAADGDEAVALFKQHKDDIGIAVLDVVMPRMGGVKAFEKLRQIEPELPVIFHTGYGRNALDHDVMMQPLCDSITKPVSIELLTAKMMAMLQRIKKD